MSQQTKVSRNSLFLFAAILCGTLQAAPVAVLAPVVEVKGSVKWSGHGSVNAETLRVGDSLAEGSAIRTGADSRVLLAPVPGIAVTVAKDTTASLLHLSVVKSGGAIHKRDAAFGLDLGTLSFSLEKRDATMTSFAVQTPNGTMQARGSVGTITVVPPCVKVASLSGRITFMPNAATGARVSVSVDPTKHPKGVASNPSASGNGTPIIIEAGWFMAICGVGEDATIRVINTIDRTWTSFSPDGTQLTTRAATLQELESTRGFFEATLAHAALAVGYDLLSGESAAGITETLTKINQSFASVGLAPIETPAVGSTSQPVGVFNPAPTFGSGGFSGGSLNPANTTGEIISRER